MMLKLWPGAERFALSDALSVECRIHHHMTERDPKILQDVGMWFREYKPGIWLNVLYQTIKDRQPEAAIITGVRFADEAELVRDLGGSIVRIVRADNGTRFVSPDRNPNHAAERDIDSLEADAEIVAASGDLAGLERGLRQWLESRTVAA